MHPKDNHLILFVHLSLHYNTVGNSLIGRQPTKAAIKEAS